MTDSDAHQRLAEAGRVLVAAHERLQALEEKKNARPVVAAADAMAITGKDASDDESNDTP